MDDIAKEKPAKKVDFGFKQEEDGVWLSIRIPIEFGMWNILGALTEAQTRVMAFFGQMGKAEEEKKLHLVRPNGDLESFKNKWR